MLRKPARRIALMQPYFFPYPRYFRLFAEVDEFVIHDDIQFIKGGRINRTQVPGVNGNTKWLTLNIAKQSSRTLICESRFADDARAHFDKSLRRLPWVNSSKGPAAERVREYLYSPLNSPIDYLERGLRLVVELLRINVRISRSSAIKLGSLRHQERVIAAVKALGGNEYVNLPGGAKLYSHDTFARHGIKLKFLPNYEGPHHQMLPALMTLPPQEILL